MPGPSFSRAEPPAAPYYLAFYLMALAPLNLPVRGIVSYGCHHLKKIIPGCSPQEKVLHIKQKSAPEVVGALLLSLRAASFTCRAANLNDYTATTQPTLIRAIAQPAINT
ncbi:hypothetical protein FRB93_011170 [Tulasnella sp. JGI-2019a]|nr:hypothetical protein FRB93_011170 [Tulasnella sp. JGI-2019a]